MAEQWDLDEEGLRRLGALTLEQPDDRTVRDSERKAAKLHFSQLGNSENFLLEVEKSDLGSLHGLPGNHSPPISARTPHVATVLRQLLELVDKHWNGSGSLLLNKKFLDDLQRKNQQLTIQVACLNQELTQLKRLEETVALLHESQRSLVVTNEYLLQQLNKEQKGYSGKSLLPPEKNHPLGRSSPFGKSSLSSSSPMAHDTGQYLIQAVSEAAPEPSLWS
ncbi:leucine rich repeat containing 36 [Cricetulus griseus]